LQLLGAQNYVQQIFYGVALLLAVTVSILIRRTHHGDATLPVGIDETAPP
jgi:hypothetical protein